MKNLFCLFLFIIGLVPSNVIAVVSISDIDIDPNLDISLFSPYTITAEISDYDISSPVTLDLEGINGDGEDCWRYYADGTCGSSILNLNMTYDSGITWKKTDIRPDQIYPQIFFAPSSVTWSYTPSDLSVRRNSYHILHLNNPFTMEADMSFWIEINTTALSSLNSSDLLVYLVKKGHNISFFNSDWRNSTDVQLVGTINRTANFNHEHSTNSKHHLIALATNANGTIGSKNLDINDDFWIIIYANSPNIARGWNLKYHNQSICDNSSAWFLGNQSGWTTSAQTGCPDVHTHSARRTEKADGIIATTTADSASRTETYSFGTLPNLSPNLSSFLTPTVGDVYEGNITVRWATSTDPNIDDSLKYDLYLLDSIESRILPILTASTSDTFYILDSTTLNDGDYSLEGLVNDGVNAGVSFNLGGNFTVDNESGSIRSITSIMIRSNGTNQLVAGTGDIITLTFEADGLINTPTIYFYSGGADIANNVTVSNTSGNIWSAVYTVSSADTEGFISFKISSSNLDQNYYDTTDSSYVNVDIIAPAIATNSSRSNSLRRIKNILSNSNQLPDFNYLSQLMNLLQTSANLLTETKSLQIDNKKFNLIFKKDLKTGMRDDDVKELQKYLNSNGFILVKNGSGSPGKETDFFGILTKNALVKFQNKNNIKPASGYFGPITRGVINYSLNLKSR